MALAASSPARGAPEQIAAGVLMGEMSQSGAQALLNAYDLCWRVQSALRLLGDGQGGSDPAQIGAGGRRFVAGLAGLPEAQIGDELARAADRAAVVISAYLGQG